MKNMVKKVFKHWEVFLLVSWCRVCGVRRGNPSSLRPQSIMNSIVNYIKLASFRCLSRW